MYPNTKCDEALKFVLHQTERSGQLIYLMIDEYDNFANTLMASSEDDYKTITHGVGAFRLFFNILKLATTGMDSPVKRMFITGVSPLTLSDVTSGFNIGANFSVRNKYNDMVGFTEDEVRKMLGYYRDATGVFNHSVDELLEIMKPWYNNNCFTSASVRKQKMFSYSDLYMEPWNGICKHSFLVELKYCKHGSTDAEVQKKYQETLDQLTQYTAAKQLKQKAQGNGWTLHQFVIVFRGWDCEACEEVNG